MSKCAEPHLECADLFGAFNEAIARESTRHLEAMMDLGDDAIEHYVRSVIDCTDIVLGSYADPSMPAGIGVVIIKGREAAHIMRETRINNKSATVIPCQTRDLAVAAMMMWGDGRPLA